MKSSGRLIGLMMLGIGLVLGSSCGDSDSSSNSAAQPPTQPPAQPQSPTVKPSQLAWAEVLDQRPDPTFVTNPDLLKQITATGLPWRVKDTGTGIEMLLIPPGSFTMGCSPTHMYPCPSNENPTHAVTLTNAFYLGRYEVTQAQWTAKMGSNPSRFQGSSCPDATSRPVERVSWEMIASFNTATGLRLPTEAEWEYAYRAQLGTAVTRTAFHNRTNDSAMLDDIAWNTCNNVWISASLLEHREHRPPAQRSSAARQPTRLACTT